MKRQLEIDSGADESGEDTLAVIASISDVEAAVQCISGYCRASESQFKGVLEHQLWSVLGNSAAATTELRYLASIGRLRLLNSNSGTGEVFAVLFSEYVLTIRKTSLSQLLTDKFIEAARTHAGLSISKKHFADDGLSDEEINSLLNVRLLLPRRNGESDDQYWFSHPDVHHALSSCDTQ